MHNLETACLILSILEIHYSCGVYAYSAEVGIESSILPIIFVFSSFRKIISELVVDRFKKRIKHLEEVQYVKISSKVNKQFISPFENYYHSHTIYTFRKMVYWKIAWNLVQVLHPSLFINSTCWGMLGDHIISVQVINFAHQIISFPHYVRIGLSSP